MSLLYGLKAIHQSASANKPHILGFNTPRSAANDTLFEVWNAATAAGIKAAIDLDGKFYSAALTAGDLLYAVAGGVAGVKRLDSLAIGAVGTVLRSTGTAPAWTTATFPATATQGDLLHATTANVWGSLAKGTARQVLQINAGATLPEWTSSLSLTAVTATTLTGTLATAAQPNVTSLGSLAANLLFVDASYDIGASGATRPRDLFLSRDATIGGALSVSGGVVAISGAVSGQTLGIIQLAGSNAASGNGQALKALAVSTVISNAGGYSTVTAIGLSAIPQFGSGGTESFASAYSLYLSATTGGTPTIGDWVGAMIEQPPGATITTAYGIKIADITAGGSNYAIWTGAGAVRFGGAVTIAGIFGCNGATAQSSYASGGALAAYGAGANGLDSGANMSALHALVVKIRAALVADGIMS